VPNTGLFTGMPSTSVIVEPPRLPRTRIAGDVERFCSDSDCSVVFAGTGVNPCCSDRTPAMLVTGSASIWSAVIVVELPVVPRSTSGVCAAAVTLVVVSVVVAGASLKSWLRVTSMPTLTFVTSVDW
jgi:hypothetical protein